MMSMTSSRWVMVRVIVSLCCGLAACDSDNNQQTKKEQHDAAAESSASDASGSGLDSSGSTYAYADWGDPFAGLPTGKEQLAKVCESDINDVVHRTFCGDAPPQIASLKDLALAFSIDIDHLGGTSGSALAAHSTSMSARSVSAINPRVFLFKLVVNLADDSGPVALVGMAFNRGDQWAELVVMDKSREYRFYLLRFENDCNAKPEGCKPGDLLTQDFEHDWSNVTLYDEKALENTVLDCATCHQAAGPDAPRMLRMQEFDPPWTHWLSDNTEGGRALVADYLAAKGDESIAGLPREDVGGISPGGIQLFVSGKDHFQPNPFNSVAIEKEVTESAAARGGKQPTDNSIPGDSATWRTAYEVAKRGEAIAVPYHDVKVTDARKLKALSDAYQKFQHGELEQSELPDLRDVFPDNYKRLAEMGMSTEPDASGEEVLIQACSQCHNERLNKDLSRARFRADLKDMDQDEKNTAIERMMLPPNDIHAMPPARQRVLSNEARDRAIEALRQ